MAELAWKIDENGVDLELAGGNLALDRGLVPMVLCSLFSDRRVEPSEVDLPSMDRRGFWGEDSDSPWGSKLWLLYRAKLTDSVIARAIRYSEDALRWLVREDIAQSVTVNAELNLAGVLDIEVEVRRGTARRRADEWAASPSEIETRFPRGTGILRLMFVS